MNEIVEVMIEGIGPIVGIGFLLGCLPMLAGLGIQVAINIFYKI